MKKILSIIFLFTGLVLVNANCKSAQEKAYESPYQKELNNLATKNKLKIILKLDDFDVKEGVSTSVPTIDYLQSKNIKAAIGFVADRCDESALSVYAPYLNAKDKNGNQLFEVWHHGFDHINPEFDGKDYTYQKAHFENADKLLKERLRVEMHSFGAPFNHNDITTNTVIAENPNYKVTMFNNPAVDSKSGILNLTNRVNIEITTGKPDYDFFINNYKSKKGAFTNYMVLQGHPKFWKTEELNQFKQIIFFLISEGCEFDLPYNYYQSLQQKDLPKKQIQHVTFNALLLRTLNDSDFDPEAVASSGLKVLYNSSNPAVATIFNGKVHIVGLGKTIITASQIGDSQFNPADYVSQTLIIK